MMSESEIFDLVTFLPHASFKDAATGRYILVSEGLAKRCRLESPAQMEGLTVDDLSFAKAPCGREFEEDIRKMDYLVLEKKLGIKMTHAGMRFADGKLIYQTISKLPIVGERKLLGIITFGHDLTETLRHQTLYFLYKKICKSKEIAIRKLLRHLEIDTYFFRPPTESELLILLERGTGRSNKEIAIERHVTVRTVDAHINSIRAKLKGDVLPRVINSLRKCSDVSQTSMM